MVSDDPVDRLAPTMLRKGTTLWRIYWDDYDPLASHPHPTGRMALIQDVPPGNPGYGGIYLASSRGGACWEVILRDAAARDGKLYLPHSALVGRSMVKLRSLAPVPVIDLRLPARHALYNTSNPGAWEERNHYWNLVLTTSKHDLSHKAAAELSAMARASGVELAGCSWTSAQHHGSTVHLIYDPPYQAAKWEVVGDCVPLPSAPGIAALRSAARDAHMKLVLTGRRPFPCEDDDP